MPIEKAFAVHASPETIWRRLLAEIGETGSGHAVLDSSIANERLDLLVELQPGRRARLTYRLQPRADYTEVSAAMEISGVRHRLMEALSLGSINIGYQAALVEGLANLKRAAEEDERRA